MDDATELQGDIFHNFFFHNTLLDVVQKTKHLIYYILFNTMN